MTITIGTDDLVRLRLRAQLLEPRTTHTVVDVVERMLAMQGQDFPHVCWAIGLRARQVRAEVLRAFDEGTIVRSWPMRGTLHVTPAEDLAWILSVTSERTLQSARKRHADLGLDGPTIDAARDVVLGALTGGGRATRAELTAAFAQAGISTEGQRGYHLIWRFAQEALVTWGPMADDRQQALVLLDEWVPNPRSLTGEEAVQHMLVRYLDGHGPATLQDFAWWTKVTMSSAKRGLQLAREAGELTELDVDGTTMWARTRSLDADVSRPTAGHVLALPGFDEYLLGYQDRSAVLDPEHADKIVPGGNGVFLPILVHHGRIIGTWRLASSDHRWFVDGPGAPSEELRRSIEDYAGFVG